MDDAAQDILESGDRLPSAFSDGSVGGVDVRTGDTRKGPSCGATIRDATDDLWRMAQESGEMLVRTELDYGPDAGIYFGLYSATTGKTRVVKFVPSSDVAVIDG